MPRREREPASAKQSPPRHSKPARQDGDVDRVSRVAPLDQTSDRAARPASPPRRSDKGPASKAKRTTAATPKPDTAVPPPGAQVEKRTLSNLIPFPTQARFFTDLPDDKLKRLAALIKRDGVSPMIQVLPKNIAGFPENSIVRGHQRVRALKLLEFSEYEVLVRYDLAEASADTIEREFLEENLARRDMDMIEQARAALRLFEIEKRRQIEWFGDREKAEARDRVGKALNMSGRNLQRYWNVLNTPLEVQNALRAGKLTLVEAERVAFLTPATQAEIARRIKAGEAPKVVVASYASRNDSRHRKLWAAVASLAKSLDRALADLDGRIDEVKPGHVHAHVATLKEALRVIKLLVAKDKGYREFDWAQYAKATSAHPHHHTRRRNSSKK
jgi:ParB-like chromosome segregation protein Spo0J